MAFADTTPRDARSLSSWCSSRVTRATSCSTAPCGSIADKASVNYRWGGLQCKGRELSDTSIQLLFAAFRSEYQVKLEYVVADYQSKSYRCVTGFTISKS